MLAINSRAKLPADLSKFGILHNLNYRELLSVNPKTEKSKIQTYILHFAPANTSGVNVCPGAGNCKAICLHFAGNPVYMNGKQAARIRRTLAYASNPKQFMLLLVCAILDKLNKHGDEELAFRLNGTSDIVWEDVDFTITPEFAAFCRVKFGRILPMGRRGNIFEMFNFMRDNTGEKVTFYDYTKVRHNWAECKRLGYHLTFSFDGYDNRSNLKLAASAISNGVNIAAAFNVKKGQPLPGKAYFCNRSLRVIDGDETDYRPSDPNGYVIIGLRFKLPHGAKWTAEQRDAFCLSATAMGARKAPGS
jgi:hypothetical protein